MARQKLINLHSFGTDTSALLTGNDQLTLGEIAVQHVDGAAKLHIRVSSGETLVAGKLASFIDESAVDSKISSSVSVVSDKVDGLEQKLGSGFDSTNTVEKAIENEAAERASGDTKLEGAISVLTQDLSAETAAREHTDALLKAETTARTEADSELSREIQGVSDEVDAIQSQLEGIPPGSSAVATYIAEQISELTDALDEITAATPANDYVTVTVSQKSLDRKQTVGVSVAVQDISTASALTQGLADAYNVKLVTNGLDNRLQIAESSLVTINSQLEGIDNVSGAVKTYVDNAVSTAVASVYKVKGSVADYASLPASGQNVGDVYNVIAAYSTYPAGTNWVWTGTEWDALGGTINLEPYLYVSAFTAYTAATNTTIGNIQSDIAKLQTDLSAETTARESGDSAIDAKFGDGISSSSTVASKISAEATARENADNAIDAKLGSGVSSENTVSTQLSSLSGSVSTLKSSAETLTQNISNEVTRATSAENNLNKAITAETEARTNADNALSGRIDTLSGSASTLHNLITAETQARENRDTQLASSAETAIQGVNTLTEQLGSGFTTTSVTEQLAAVKSTADSAVQSVVVASTETNLITATKSGTTVTLNFDNMVIDCGTY